MLTESRAEVRIENGHLFIGNDSYPLRNIARTSIRHWTYVTEAPSWAVKGAWLSGVIAVATLLSGEILGGLAILVVTAICVARLFFKKGPLHLTSLEVTTSGVPWDAVISDDADGIARLREQMTLATNSLEVKYSTTLNTFQTENGDLINAQRGSVGKVSGNGTGISNGG